MSTLKIPADYHLHSEFSSDCNTDIDLLIKSSMDKGLSSICITDHNDLDFPDVPDHMKFDLDMDAYKPRLKELREKYSPEFDIRFGVEQGVMPSTCERLNNFSSIHPELDFIICSSHVVKGKDPYYPDAFQYPDGSPIEPSEVYLSYFEDMLYNVTHFTDYSVYGHIDYIFRYGPDHVDDSLFRDKYFDITKDILHDILENIIKNGKGIEINTGSLYRGMDFMHPHPLILQMYKDLGGEIITFGSDAHDTQHIAYSFDKAVQLAKDMGFKAFCTFKNLKPEFHSF